MRRVVVAALGVLLAAGCAGNDSPRTVSSRVQEYEWRLADRDYTATTELLAAYGSLWAATTEPVEIVRFDPATGQIAAQIALTADIQRVELAAGGDAIWLVTHPEDGLRVGVWRLDPASNEVEQVCETNYMSGLAFADDALWTFGYPDPDPASTGGLARFDPVSCQFSGASPEGTLDVLAGEDAVWGIGGEHRVSRIDPATGEITPVLSPEENSVPTAAAVGAGAVWLGIAALDDGEDSFLRIDADTGAAQQLDIAGRVEAVAVEGDVVWALVDAPDADSALVRLDPDTGTVLDTVPDTSGADLVVLDGEPWLASGDDFLRVPSGEVPS